MTKGNQQERAGAAAPYGRFERIEDLATTEYAPGVTLRSVMGQGMQMIQATFAPHSEAPIHSHAEEQILLVLDGEMDFVLDGETRRVRVGDVVVVPPWVEHGARTGNSRCTEVEFFNPPRWRS